MTPIESAVVQLVLRRIPKTRFRRRGIVEDGDSSRGESVYERAGMDDDGE